MSLFGSRLETVANPRVGVNVARVPWIGFDFFSQLIDEDPQILRFFTVVRSPNSLQQAPMTESNSLVRDEMAEQFEFLGREPDGIFAERHGTLGEIYLQVVGDKRGRGFLGGASADSGTDAREEFLSAEWFYDVVVCAGVECLDFVALGVANGEHDDGNIARLADFAADI